MGDRQQADRDAGPLRWGREQREMLWHYLCTGQIDVSRIDSAGYLRELAAWEEVWRVFQLRGKQRNFNQNVRRGVCDWQVEEAVAGNRRGNEGKNDDDDDDDDDLDFDPDGAFFLLLFPSSRILLIDFLFPQLLRTKKNPTTTTTTTIVGATNAIKTQTCLVVVVSQISKTHSTT